MGMIEDIMKALERIPGWKRIRETPDELDKLKTRVAALEAKLDGKSGELCPMCNAPTFKRIASVADKKFAFAGLMRDTFECQSCQHREDRQRDTMQK